MFCIEHKISDKTFPIKIGTAPINMLVDSGLTLKLLDHMKNLTHHPDQESQIWVYFDIKESLALLRTFKAYTTALDEALFANFMFLNVQEEICWAKNQEKCLINPMKLFIIIQSTRKCKQDLILWSGRRAKSVKRVFEWVELISSNSKSFRIIKTFFESLITAA